jgi:hypothetical protein
MAINAGRADIFGAPIELLPAIGTDDIAQQFAEIFDVWILANGEGLGHARMLHCNGFSVKPLDDKKASPRAFRLPDYTLPRSWRAKPCDS